MAICPKCKTEDEYSIIQIKEYIHNNDFISVITKVCCDECYEEFWVREVFDFADSYNIKDA